MLDHVILGVGDYPRSKAFYEAALAPLGYEPVMEIGEVACGLGTKGKPYFWIGAREVSGPTHVAFASPDRATVDAFHRAATAAGGRDNVWAYCEPVWGGDHSSGYPDPHDPTYPDPSPRTPETANGRPPN